MPLESRVDVLIIGAGPAGLMCANALAMTGVDVPAGHADGIQPRTIEVLESYGLTERLFQEGARVYMTAFYNPKSDGGIECTGRFPGINPPTSARHSFQIMLHQGAIESIFLNSLRKHGVEVERPKEPVGIDISDDVDKLSRSSSHPVKVTIERLNTTDEENRVEIVHAKFVVGADGAHSWVRKSLGIEMEGEQTDYIWGVIDMVPETDFPDIRNVTAIRSDDGSGLIIPREGDRIRFYVQLSDTDVILPSTGRVDKSKMTPQKLLSAARKILHPFELGEPKEIDWWTVYIIGQRLASKYSVNDRVFIIGDACHTHSPKAGQGMNAGINDAHNLAWKLAQVLRGWSNLSLLKTYEYERRKFAEDLINFDKMLASRFSEKPRTAEDEEGMSHEQFLEMLQTSGSFISGVGVHYSPSTIVDPKHQKCAENLVVGQRMPPQIFVRAADTRPIEIQDLLPPDIRFKVLFFVGNMTGDRVAELNLLAEELNRSSSFLHKYSADGNISTAFDIITIATGKNPAHINYLLFPVFFRPHWSKVFLDDTDVTGRKGGQGYERFGLDPEKITVVIVRPDGYVGMIAPSTALADLDKYFGSFVLPHDLEF